MIDLEEYDDQSAEVSTLNIKTGDRVVLGTVGDKVNLPDGDREGTAENETYSPDEVTIRILNRKIEGLYVTPEQARQNAMDDNFGDDFDDDDEDDDDGYY
jgi:hypothetical protein